MTEPSYIKLDSRGRVTLGKLATGTAWYRATVDKNGVVTLVPVEGEK